MGKMVLIGILLHQMFPMGKACGSRYLKDDGDSFPIFVKVGNGSSIFWYVRW